jgi:peptide/nickel transport system permease protein
MESLIMWAYVVRRILLAVPTVLGIVLLTFALFTLVAKDPARLYAGKRATPQVLAAVRHKMGLDKPLWLNVPAYRQSHRVSALFEAQFPDVLAFRFPESMRYEESVWSIFKRKAPVSLAVQLPIFIIELGIQLVLALLCAKYRGRAFDRTMTFLSVLGMSVPALCIYLAAQSLLGAKWHLFPVAGWDTGFYAMHFAALPILVSVFASLGGGTRFYRTVALDEINADYVRTARAKGLPEGEVLLTHVLRNVLIPVITSTVTTLPLLFLGALFLERIFQIPGIGGLLVESIFNNDRPVIMFTVYLTSVIYCLALIATDICYTLADPRVTFS